MAANHLIVRQLATHDVQREGRLILLMRSWALNLPKAAAIMEATTSGAARPQNQVVSLLMPSNTG